MGTDGLVQEIPEIQEVRLRIVENTLLVISVAGWGAGIFLALLNPSSWYRHLFFGSVLGFLAFGLRRIAPRKGFKVAAWGFISGSLAIFTIAALTAGGLGAPVVYGFLGVVVLSGVLIGPRGGFGAAVLVVLISLGLAMADAAGRMPAPWIVHTVWSRWTQLSAYSIVLALIQAMATRAIERSLAYATHEIGIRKETERALQGAQEELEHKVTARTEELARTVAALEAQTRELIAAREAQARFLALVSHELRTPLTSVRASLAMLAARKDLPPDVRPLTEIADRNSIRLLNLTNELLDLEKAGAGLFRVRMEAVDLRDPIRDACEGVRTLAEGRGFPIEVHLPEGPAPVIGDGPRLEQVALNLLSNALKHAKGEGVLTIRVELRPEGAWVGISNPGDPIPDSFQDRIFHTFHQLEPQAGTSGLGLSLSKAIIEAHGGRIGFESEPEITTFFFLLPLQTGE